ncbi:endonuclease/exonuclease/phosphatase family protein (macronuclear) [Tetrahymena thermophila SB210]|uniref:Endonuclease/exonuclease/phosphatase family protein n=1 Tax=Tetrahymena thermophila (strain SB210) TaxID=312017 RepID=Q23AB0_TETTS|nr:endonuclease/exonuclease/phosphatase family protein [Tetrahymena thermophila SB210]EAR93582.1 endonuclease/exonuclease/phosphatase family protein [Tetrahymena thermophila SB210]|eukprot:XP_001013827.1 endonuclease/exonuclease/phosphatase family protein [Tetrahymena thermophila SB210]
MDLLLEDLRVKQTVKKTKHGFQKVGNDVNLSGIEKLKFISYNVWFEKHNFEERNIELRKIFLQFDPDFICLQEVTQDFLQLIFSDDQICDKYYFSSSSLVQAYDVLILSKYPIPFKCRYFPSEMGRNLLFGVITINDIDISIGTTHLESIDYNDDYRLCQLTAIEDQFKSYQESILMGDFNFAKKSEDQNIPEGYYDVWHALHPNEEGHTMQASQQYPSIRFDRIILKQSENWKPSHIELIGRDPLPSYQSKQFAPFEIITPSDHYGLYLELSFIGKKS